MSQGTSLQSHLKFVSGAVIYSFVRSFKIGQKSSVLATTSNAVTLTLKVDQCISKNFPILLYCVSVSFPVCLLSCRCCHACTGRRSSWLAPGAQVWLRSTFYCLPDVLLPSCCAVGVLPVMPGRWGWLIDWYLMSGCCIDFFTVLSFTSDSLAGATVAEW